MRTLKSGLDPQTVRRPLSHTTILEEKENSLKESFEELIWAGEAKRYT